MGFFKNVREFFWPLLEDEADQEHNEITSSEIKIETDNLKSVLDYIIKRYEAEEDRKKTTETKSSLFIGTISVVTTVIIGITSVLINNNTFNLMSCCLVFLLFALTVYMARTIWFSVQALERKNYYTLSVNDFLISEKGDEYYQKIISEISNKIKRNYNTINSKVDSMMMAQEYFKRSIVIVSLYAFMILVFFISKTDFGMGAKINGVTESLNGLTLSGWNIAIIYTLILATLFIGLKALKKAKNKNSQ